jgi:hypothetical protein
MTVPSRKAIPEPMTATAITHRPALLSKLIPSAGPADALAMLRSYREGRLGVASRTWESAG